MTGLLRVKKDPAEESVISSFSDAELIAFRIEPRVRIIIRVISRSWFVNWRSRCE